ncbi:MAG: hypothetical protein IJI48_03730, partial [Ruminococcus sp.]|nr:hypothetical protein [Ruminococcus sp.]
MLKFKKIISLLLAVLMVMSAFTVMTTAAGAVTYEDTKLYFDLSSTGWELGAKDKVGFYVFSAEYGELLPWGGKKLNGTDEGDGIWSYDPAAKGMDIKEGEQYKIIFTGAGNQTYDLIFDTTCYGHVAYCDDTIYENPVDSSKQTRAAFWKDMDATKYGPVLQISSIGTVVGTCPEEGKTPLTIFEDFLTNTLANARTYMVDTGKKTEQQLIDDIGEGLGLTKDDVAASIASTDTESTWSADASALPAAAVPTEAHTHTPGEAVQENVVPASCKAEGSYDEVVYCTECGEEISREAKTIDKLAHTPGEAVYENEVVTHGGIYIPFVVYCTECGEEISRETLVEPIVTHSLTFVDEVPATYEADGVKAHYECSVCGALCLDARGLYTVSAAELVIPKLTPTEPETQTIETVTPEPGEPTYYIVGGFTDWQMKEEYAMTKIAEGDSVKYLFKDLALASTDQFKVVSYNWSLPDPVQTWYPDGMGNNYGENGEITAEGTYDVYFDPALATDGWFYNCIYVDGMPAPTQPAPTEPETQAHTPTPGDPVEENVVYKHNGTYIDYVVYCTGCGVELSRETV